MSPAGQKLILIGCSAGGFDSLKALLPALPAEASGSVVIVLHIASHAEEALPVYFSTQCKLPVKEVEDKESIRPGTVYFAPPGYHVLVEADRSFSLSVEEPVLFSRPSIDVLFESAAVALKRNVLGVILSGANSDGSHGLRRVLDEGGAGLVEDPRTAIYPTMPEAAIEQCSGLSQMRVMALADIGQELVRQSTRRGGAGEA